MLTVYVPGPSGLVAFTPVPGEPIPPETVWIDMLFPQPQEIHRVEQVLGIELPTREEMQEIEVSSRLYAEDNGLFMTAVVLSQSDTDHPENTAVTFVLSRDKLVTLRHAEPKPFRAFTVRAMRHAGLKRGDMVLTALLEAVIDRAADILERVGLEVDALSRKIFQHTGLIDTTRPNFPELLRDVGQAGDLNSRARESLMSIGRLLAFLSQALPAKSAKDQRAQVKTQWRDVQSLLDHANFVAGKITFLLDATLGMINIEQNAIIKIFSVVAVIFLPPTLVASIYGMNFHFMPELDWPFGYPLALVLMMISAVLPYLFFKRKGWL